MMKTILIPKKITYIVKTVERKNENKKDYYDFIYTFADIENTENFINGDYRTPGINTDGLECILGSEEIVSSVYSEVVYEQKYEWKTDTKN